MNTRALLGAGDEAERDGAEGDAERQVAPLGDGLSPDPGAHAVHDLLAGIRGQRRGDARHAVVRLGGEGGGVELAGGRPSGAGR